MIKVENFVVFKKDDAESIVCVKIRHKKECHIIYIYNEEFVKSFPIISEILRLESTHSFSSKIIYEMPESFETRILKQQINAMPPFLFEVIVKDMLENKGHVLKTIFEA